MCLIKYKWSNFFTQRYSESQPTSAHVVDESSKPVGRTVFQVISKRKSSAELVTWFYKGNNLWFYKGKNLEPLG